MSNTDNYDFEKSKQVQGEDKYSPYARKDWNYINDINNSNYQNNGLTMVQFDLSSIYNSSRMTDGSDLYLTIPIVLCAAFTSSVQALLTPVAGNCNLLSMKSNYVNLLHQADLIVNGKTVEETQPYLNSFLNLKMMSEMSINDLQNLGPTIGFSECIDSYQSQQWNSSLATVNGTGMTNNKPFGFNAVPATEQQLIISPYQNNNTANKAVQLRLSNIVDTTQPTHGNKIFGSGRIMTATQLANEFKPYYTVLNTNYMVWYDYAVIRLKDVFESMANMGLTKRFDANLRLYFNTGALSIPVVNPNLITLQYGAFSISNSTITNTCPFTVNYLADISDNGGLPTTTAFITAGCFIARVPNTTVGSSGANLSLSGASSPMNACRCYYSSIELEPSIMRSYIETNRNKAVIYRSVISNQISAVSSGSSYSALLQSGMVGPVAVILIPYISSTQDSLGYYQWQSPYDSCPATGAPLSLTNMSVTVGGVQQLATPLYYSYENFIEQVSVFEKLTSSDFGVSVGLFNKKWWENNRSYIVNIRSTPADMITPRNINVSFTNNSSVAIDVLAFCVCLKQFDIDVETGLIKRVGLA